MGIKKILTKDIGSGEGPKPLTFKKALSVLLFIPGFFLLSIGYIGKTGDSTPAIRLWGWAFFSLGVAFAVWHILTTSSKRNIYPDVLSMIFDTREIFEAGGIQLSFLISQMKDEIRIATITQNMHDSITNIQMDFKLQFSKRVAPISLPSLKHNLGSSEVIFAQYRFPLSKAQMQNKHAKITPSIRTKVTKRSPVRFDRRQVFDTKTKPWLSFLMLAGPVATFGGGRYFTMQLNPVAAESKSKLPSRWALHTLWSPSARKPKEEIIKIINSKASKV